MSIKNFTFINPDNISIEMVEIDDEQGNATVMTKAAYDATLAANSAPTAQ